jgi:Flp pilus assembly pilin Flp
VAPRLRASQRGQGLVEYTLILALVVIVTVAVLGLLGRQMLDAFRNVANTMQAP